MSQSICLAKQTGKLPSFLLAVPVKDKAGQRCVLIYINYLISTALHPAFVANIARFPLHRHWPLTVSTKQFHLLYCWRKWGKCRIKACFVVTSEAVCVIVPCAVMQWRFHEQSQRAQDVWHGPGRSRALLCWLCLTCCCRPNPSGRHLSGCSSDTCWLAEKGGGNYDSPWQQRQSHMHAAALAESWIKLFFVKRDVAQVSGNK